MQGNPIARCFIKANDPNNCLYLTNKFFIVKIKGKAYDYDLEQLRQLSWSNRILLLPVVLGGLLSTLSVFAYMNGLLAPWLLVILFISGILLMYYGFLGAPALVVHLKNAEESYLLFKHSIYLQGFTDFVNSYIFKKEAPEYYIEIDINEWQKIEQQGFLQVDRPRKLLIKPSDAKNKIMLHIDFEQVNGAITYLPDNNNELIPHVTENIPLSAVNRIG